MDEEFDYREALEEARRRMAECGRNGSDEALDAHWEVCCGDVLLAEENLRKQDRVWENASLAREFLALANFLEGYDTMLDNLYTALRRMRSAISEHPRLEAEILELEQTVIHRIEALCGHELEASEEVDRELALYRQNIDYADKGLFDKIVQKGHLRKDPIEWSPDYENIIDEATRQTYSLLEGYPRGMGFCFAYWSTKKQVLKERYGLDWKSPSAMNPRVIFD